MLGLALLLGIGLALALGSAIAYTMWSLTHPPRRTYASAVARARAGDPSELDEPLAFEAYEIELGRRRYPIWEVRGHDPAGPTVVLTHGWGDSRVGALVRAPALAPVASRLVMWDMPGHGEAPGTSPMGTNEHRLLLELLEHVASRDENGALPRIILYGWSLGAGVSIVAAGEGTSGRWSDRIAGVVAEAPYRLAQTPARNVLKTRQLPHRLNLPPAFWLLGLGLRVGPTWRRFDRAQHAARLTCPLLVIHGTEDAICPIDDGRAIAEAAPDGRIIEVCGAGHNNLWTEEPFGDTCRDGVRGFIGQASGADRAAPARAAP